MKFLVVLSVVLAVAIATPNYGYENYGGYEGGSDVYGSGYGGEGYGDHYGQGSYGGYEGYDGGFGYRKKRSIAYGVVPSSNVAYSSLLAQPAVSTVYSSPSVYSPLVKSAVVSPYYQSAHLYGSSPVYVGGAAVSHQSHVQLKSSPAFVSQQVVQPIVPSHTYVQSPAVFQPAPAVVEARSVYAPSYYAQQPAVVQAPAVVGVQTPAVVGVHAPSFVQTPAYLADELLLKKKRETEKKTQ